MSDRGIQHDEQGTDQREQSQEGENQSGRAKGEGGQPGQDHDLAGMEGQQQQTLRGGSRASLPSGATATASTAATGKETNDDDRAQQPAG